MCDTKAACERAEQRVREILARLGLDLHPDKTRQVGLSWGREGFDFLGCHLHKRLSGRIWEQRRKRLYFLQRWPSRRAMQRMRARVKALTPRGGCHRPLRDIIAQLNPVLRGWGAYFRTGNAAIKFGHVDDYVAWRLKRLLMKRYGRNLRRGPRGPVDARLLPCARTLSPARDDSVSGGCVMPYFESPLVRRVPEIGTHGLNGGRTHSAALARCDK
jgi:RNA-directed DNA polymerase